MLDLFGVRSIVGRHRISAVLQLWLLFKLLLLLDMPGLCWWIQPPVRHIAVRCL